MCRRCESDKDEDNVACEGGRQAACGGNGEMRDESSVSPSGASCVDPQRWAEMGCMYSGECNPPQVASPGLLSIFLALVHCQ